MRSINIVPALPGANQPRGLVKVCGAVIPGWISWEVDNNTFHAADTFRVLIALDAPGMVVDAAWFAGMNAAATVEIYAGYPPDPAAFTDTDLDLLIVGAADDVYYDPLRGTVELTGRDLTARLQDTKTSEKWINLTASEIAEVIAERHGLKPVVTKTATKAGLFYEIDQVKLTVERSEWDLLSWLAREEQFMLYVKGDELHFEPRPDPESDLPYVLLWEPPDDTRGSLRFNGAGLSFSRSLTLARDLVVTVKSWNAKAAKGFARTVKSTKSGVRSSSAAPQMGTPDAQLYTFSIPGLAPEEALQRALAILADLSRQEMRLTLTGPADNLLGASSIIEMRGTGTAYDQIYYPESITRRMSVTDGYAWTVQAKNSSPETVVTG